MLAVLAAAASALASTPNLILVSNYEETRWCAHETVAPASARAAAETSLTVVNVWTSAGEITDLKVVWGPESADWMATDTYRFDDWAVLSVERNVVYVSTDERLSQTFTRQSDRLVRTRSDRVGITPDADVYDPEVPPYADLSKAPFHGLLVRALAARRLPKDGLCAASTGVARRDGAKNGRKKGATP